MFRDRKDAGRRLAEMLKGYSLHDPLVLGVPRGGVVIGAELARELKADLDVALSRKLRAPDQPELALGAISEDGRVYLADHAREFACQLEEESRYQLAEIERRKKLYRAVRPQAPIAGRSVIVTDDGIATGSTMIAALQTVKMQNPREVLIAVPIASPDRLAEIRRWCDNAVCLSAPKEFWAIGEFYDDFAQVEDEEVIALLRQCASGAMQHPSNRDIA